jgi:hypothetical protein
MSADRYFSEKIRRRKRVNNFDIVELLLFIVCGLFLAFMFSIVGGIIYIVVHFIKKVW